MLTSTYYKELRTGYEKVLKTDDSALISQQRISLYLLLMPVFRSDSETIIFLAEY